MDFMDSRGGRFVNLCRPVVALRLGLLPLKEVWRLGCLDAWVPGGLEPRGLDLGALEAGWLACWLAGLDWIGFGWLLALALGWLWTAWLLTGFGRPGSWLGFGWLDS